MRVVTWLKGSVLPGRHVVGVKLSGSIPDPGASQRRGDGKDCAPLPPEKWRVRPACLAILGEVFALGDAWNLPSEGKGVGLLPAGQSSRRGRCAGTDPF